MNTPCKTSLLTARLRHVTPKRGRIWLATSLGLSVFHGCSGEVPNEAPGPLPQAGTVPQPSGIQTEPPAGNLPAGDVTTTTGTPVVAPGGPAPTATATGPNPVPVTFSPAPGAYRRLTNAAFTNSLRDLLRGPVVIEALEPDSWAVGGLPTVGAAEMSVSELGVERYQGAVEGAVEQAFSDSTRRDEIVGCAPRDVADVECFSQFVNTFGQRVFRQPLTETQAERYLGLVTDVAATLNDPVQGLRAAATAFLLSPNFLYRLERGEPVQSADTWRYTSYETATRLAYFLTNSTPDEELLDLASEDALATKEGVLAQAERLLETEFGRQSVGNFAQELYQVGLVLARAKDPELYPEYGRSLQDAMVREVSAMFEAVVFDQNASAMELFTTRKTFVTNELAALYGVTVDGVGENGVSAITLPEERAGLLGTAAILSIYGSQKEGSPTLRGKFVREVLLCQPMPAPPADVSTNFEDPPAGEVLTKREKLIRHQEQPTCAGCHALMDPIGLTLEHYDAIGKYRATDQGEAIDVTGNLDGSDFNGGVELGQLLASKSETGTCLLRSLYRYGTGHVETPNEGPVLDELNARFVASGYNLKDLMLGIVGSDGFRFVAPPAL